MPRAVGQFAVTGGLWAHLAAAAPANRAPVAGADALVRLASSVVAKVPLATLLGNDTDPDGDGLSITAVNDPLPAGATVVIAGAWAIYTVPAAGAGNGSFTYTLADGAGGHSVAGSVTVGTAAAPVPGFGPNAVAVVPSGADILVHFLGVPGFTYRAQYSTDAGPPYTWREFTPPAIRTAPAAGVFSHTDVAPPEAMRLYRAILNP